MSRVPIVGLVSTLAVWSLATAALARGSAPPDTLRLSRSQAVKTALAHNPALDASRAQIDEARARVRQATSLPDPTFEAALEEERGFLSPGSSTSKDLGIGLTLPFPTKLKLSGDVARSDLKTTELALTQTRDDVSQQTGLAYDALLVAQRRHDDLTQAQALAQDFFAKTEARFQAGTVAGLDVVKAKVDVAQAENDLIANERALATARATLNRWLGRAPGAPIEATDVLDVPPPLPDIEALVAMAATARPEAQSVIAQQQGARSATRLAREYWLPDLALTLSRNYTAGDPAAYSTALSVNLPLFFWQHHKGEIAEARHRERELVATGRDVAAQIELDVRTAYAAADTAQRQALYLRDQLLPEAQEAYRITSTSYGLGGASALDLLDAKRTLLDAQQQLAEALGAANDARADLERAVGGALPQAPTGGTDAH